MKAIKVKAVIAVLEAKGWINVRMRGDHRIFRKEGEPRPIPVPGGLNDDLAIGTLKSILRQAGISESELD
ncbi:type II toxin-antitoxin system HicA family toxin [Parabacteroides johnsonii]|uniref:type II toxin-antitoxin system HicA family toxin n=1 Tax=Parabacteroides johnsonii TaxID=387661 RepID=UPI0011DD113C|nr:type II toxin-antitoxin system HicA family toxin [Parabacteroides johnsonii]